MNYLVNILICLTLVLSVSAGEKNSIKMELVSIKAGEFQMGGGKDFKHMRSVLYPKCISTAIMGQEGTNFKVKISKDFLIGKNEVTVGQFKEFVKSTGYKTDAEKSSTGMVVFSPAKHKKNWQKGSWEYFFKSDKTKSWKNPGFDQSDHHPVVGVSWNDAKAFCKWLSKKEGKKYRLPTEAEWEYVCKAGTSTQFSFGDKIRNVIHTKANVANVELEKMYPDMVQRQWLLDVNIDKADKFPYTAPVGSFPSNPWGVNDMHGNVWEWCEDHYNQYTYKKNSGAKGKKKSKTKKTVVDPLNTERENDFAEHRVTRGGSWYTGPMLVRSSARGYFDAPESASYLGFRVVREK